MSQQMSQAEKLVYDERDALLRHYTHLTLKTSDIIFQSPPVRGGGYADIYRATYSVTLDPSRKEPVNTQLALKVLRVGIMSSEETLKLEIIKKLREEISIWYKLDHPNIQSLFGLWCNDKWPLPVMVSLWQDNGNLVEYIRSIAKATAEGQEHDLPAVKLDLIEGTLNGLTYLHGQNIVHADIKAENVLVSSSGTALLCDFGISWTSIKSSIAMSLRKTAQGTDEFEAPELLGFGQSEDDGTIPYSFASDIWAFGCLFYHVISGTLPWRDMTQAKRYKAMDANKLFSRPALDVMDDQHWEVVRYCCRYDVPTRPTAAELLPIMQKLRK